MKYINRIIVALFAVLGIASCDTDNIGAIYTPTMQNISFEVEEVSAKTADDNYTMNVRLTRNISAGTYTAHLNIKSEEDGIFTLENNGAIEFADGSAVTYIKVTATNMKKGQEYAAILSLSEADMAQADTITKQAVTECKVAVMCDYNWVSAGKAVFNDILWAEDAFDVNMMHAEGSNIYRIVSPYGNIDFTLANDGAVGFKDGVVAAYSSDYQIYFYASQYPDYNYVTNDNGFITFTSFILYNGSLYTGQDFGMPDDRVFELDWKEGYPLK